MAQRRGDHRLVAAVPFDFSTKDEIHERYGISAVRPLADNTMRRIIRGVDKFTINPGRRSSLIVTIPEVGTSRIAKSRVKRLRQSTPVTFAGRSSRR